MIAPSQINLVDGSVLFTPIGKLDEAVLLRYIGDRSDNRISYKE
jgi:hypothetical protein